MSSPQLMPSLVSSSSWTTVSEVTEAIFLSTLTLNESTTVQTASVSRRGLATVRQNKWLSVATVLIGLLGLLGNGLVIYVFLRKTKLHKQVMTKYILNQSFLDLVSSLILLVNELVTLSHRYDIGDTAIRAFCNGWPVKHFLLYGLILSSTYNLVAISLERYMAIVHPIVYRTRFTNPVAVVSIVFIWSSGLLYMAFVRVPTPYVDLKGICRYLTPSKAKKLINAHTSLIVKVIIPIIVHGFCYAMITIALRSKAKRVGVSDSTTATDSTVSSTDGGAQVSKEVVKIKNGEMKRTARANVIKTFAVVTTVYLICWLPQNIYVLLFRYGVLKRFNITYTIFVGMNFANCCVNPFVYVAKYDDFRKGIAKVFGKPQWFK